MVHGDTDGHEHGLRGERLGAEIGSGDGQDLEGEPLGDDHDEGGAGEPEHRAPVVEDSRVDETGPAFVRVGGEEEDVKQEEERLDGKGDGRCEGDAFEAEVEMLEVG